MTTTTKNAPELLPRPCKSKGVFDKKPCSHAEPVEVRCLLSRLPEQRCAHMGRTPRPDLHDKLTAQLSRCVEVLEKDKDRFDSVIATLKSGLDPSPLRKGLLVYCEEAWEEIQTLLDELRRQGGK